MDNSTNQRIKDLLEANEKIGIAVGKNPSIDDMGAALALYLSFNASNKKVSIASASEPIVEVSSLVGIDKVKTNFEGESGDLVVSFPYREADNGEGEIQKVSYTIENGYLNIVVKAGENGLSFSEQDVKYKRGGGTPTLLFVIGTPRLSDLGTLFNPDALKDTTIVNIDNKSDNQGFGDVVLVSPRFSSVSEQVANLVSHLGFTIDVDTAQNLFSGITFATNNFQKPTTSYLAFEMAGLLLQKGALRTKSLRHDTPHPTSFVQEDVMTNPFLPSRQQPQTQPARQDGQRDQQQQQKQKDTKKTPPPDWLMPKVYKGSTTL